MSELIDTAGIAKALGLERTYVTDRVVKREDFPAPAFALSNKTVRWRLSDFESWVRAQSARAAKKTSKRIAHE